MKTVATFTIPFALAHLVILYMVPSSFSANLIPEHRHCCHSPKLTPSLILQATVANPITYIMAAATRVRNIPPANPLKLLNMIFVVHHVKNEQLIKKNSLEGVLAN